MPATVSPDSTSAMHSHPADFSIPPLLQRRVHTLGHGLFRLGEAWRLLGTRLDRGPPPPRVRAPAGPRHQNCPRAGPGSSGPQFRAIAQRLSHTSNLPTPLHDPHPQTPPPAHPAFTLSVTIRTAEPPPHPAPFSRWCDVVIRSDHERSPIDMNETSIGGWVSCFLRWHNAPAAPPRSGGSDPARPRRSGGSWRGRRGGAGPRMQSWASWPGVCKARDS